MIVQQLRAIQKRFGYLPAEELKSLTERTGTPRYRLEEVSSFFPHFHRKPPPRVAVMICRDMACQLRGACQLQAALSDVSQQLDASQLSVTSVSCLGRCDRAPAACVVNTSSRGEDRRVYTYQTCEKLRDVVERTVAAVEHANPEELPPADTDFDWKKDQASDWKIDVYRDGGLEPYEAVRRFVRNAELGLNWNEKPQEELPRGLDAALDEKLADPRNLGEAFKQEYDPQRLRVVAALFTAGLLGMGGAGGRAYKKWFDVRQAKGLEKYIVCNADESEPGTFKDRELLLRAPHLVVEGVILGGLVVKAAQGYIYMRHEYREQIKAIENEIRRAEELGVCGENVLQTGVSFPIEVFESPGGYICGEQTALIEAMEDKRAEPRNRPPELQTNGLWDKPTLLNNVETLAWVPSIVLRGDGQWYRDQGAGEGFQGRRFFSISGDVERPGVYEVPNGIRLRRLIDDYAGGMRGGQALKAFAPSGPSGGFLPAKLPVKFLPGDYVKAKKLGDATHFDILDMELDIGVARKMGLMLGAGLVVYGEEANMVDQAISCLTFYRNESCGKCVPCRIGSQKLVEMGLGIRQGTYDSAKLATVTDIVDELAETMELTAICGLGTVAANPLKTLLLHFPRDVRKYIKQNGDAANTP